MADLSKVYFVDGRPATPYPHPSSHYTPGDAYFNTEANSLARQPPRKTYGNLTEHTVPSRRDYSSGGGTTASLNRSNIGKRLRDRPRGRMPSTRTRRPSRDLGDLVSDDMPIDHPMGSSTLVEVVDKLDQIFDHIHYAICGLGAMALWGYTQSRPAHISILVPDYSKDVIKSWGKSKNLETHPDKPDYLWLRTRDNIPRKIRIKWLSEENFSKLSLVSVPLSLTPEGGIGMTDSVAGSSAFGGLANTKVLSLASTLNQAAEAYVKDKRTQSNARDGAKFMSGIEKQIFWLLHKIIDDGLIKQGAVSLTPETVPAIVDPRFWDAVTKKFPEAPGLFAQAGLEDAKAVRNEYQETTDRYDGYGAKRSSVNNSGMYMHDHAGRSLTSVFTGVASNVRNSMATSVATYDSPVDRKPVEASDFQADSNCGENKPKQPSSSNSTRGRKSLGRSLTKREEARQEMNKDSQVSPSGLIVATVNGETVTSGMFGNLFRDDV